MADLLFELAMRDDGTPVLKNLQRTAQETGTVLERMARQAAGGFSALDARIITLNQGFDLIQRGARGVASFFNAMIRSAAEAELVQRQLRGTLISTGQFTEGYIDVLNRQAGALQSVTRFNDEEINTIQRLLIGYGASARQIEGLTKTVLDLAEGMGMDATSAADLLGKAVGGATEMFSRYGIKVTEGASATQKLLEIQTQIDTRFSGQSTTAADTYAGRVRNLANAWDDLRETAGKFITSDPLLTEALKGASEFIKSLSGEANQRRVNMLTVSVSELEAQIVSLGNFSLREVLTRPLEELAEKASPSVRVLLTQLQGLREQLGQMRDEVNAAPGDLPPPRKPRLDTTGTDAARKATDGLIESLDKQVVSLEVQRIKLEQGEPAALKFALAQELIALKAKLANDKLPLPAGLDAQYQKLTDKILAQADALEKARFNVERLVEVAKRDSQDSAEFLTVNEDLDAQSTARKAAASSLAQEIAELERQTTVEVTEESLRRMVVIGQEYDQRIQLVEKWLQAEITAGRASEDTFKRAADLRASIGESAAQKSKEAFADSASSVTDLARQGVADISGLVNSAINGAEDLGRQSLTVILQLIAKLIEAQALFSFTDGKQGSNIFGAGSGFGSLFSGVGDWFSEFDFDWGSIGDWIGSFFHDGGLIGAPAMARRVDSSVFKAARRLHGGGLTSNEVPIIAERGEFMMSRPAVRNIGAGALEHMNRTGKMPGSDDGGGGEQKIQVTVDFKNAQIIPRAPWVEAKDVAKISAKSIVDKGVLHGAIAEYGPKR